MSKTQSSTEPECKTNDKGFLEFSRNLLINDRYKMESRIRIGPPNSNRFARGRYGSVFIVKDLKNNNEKKVIKVLRRAPDAKNFTKRELRVLKRITSTEIIRQCEKHSNLKDFDTTAADLDKYVSKQFRNYVSSALKFKSSFTDVVLDAMEDDTRNEHTPMDTETSPAQPLSNNNHATNGYTHNTDTTPEESDNPIDRMMNKEVEIPYNEYIIQLLDYGKFNDHAYFIFDYFEVTLQQHLDMIAILEKSHSKDSKSKEKRMVVCHPIDIWLIFYQMLSALSHCHKVCNVMHLDLKPSNIMINRWQPLEITQRNPTNTSVRQSLIQLTRCNATLIDFSVSEKAPWGIDLDAHPCKGHYGTKRYRAPEMIMGTTWNRSIDIYALAVIILECLAGHRITENRYETSEQRAARMAEKRREKQAKLKEMENKNVKLRPFEMEPVRKKRQYSKEEIIEYLQQMSEIYLDTPRPSFIKTLPEPHYSYATQVYNNASKQSIIDNTLGNDGNESKTDDSAMSAAIVNPRIHTLIYKKYSHFIESGLLSGLNLSKLQKTESLLSEILVWKKEDRITPESGVDNYFAPFKNCIEKFLSDTGNREELEESLSQILSSLPSSS